MKTFLIRYVATVRGGFEIEACDEEAAREIVEAHGYEPQTCEQTDFEITSCREVEL